MKIKNTVLPLFLCALMVLFLVFVPEKISEIYDEATIGKLTVSKVEEGPSEKLSVLDSIKLICDYEENENIVCVEEVYYWENPQVQEEMGIEQKKPGEELMMRIQEELSMLQQFSLLPQVSLEDPEVLMFQSALYMDITDDDMRVSFADLFLGMDGMAIGVRYDIENGKFLSYQYSGNRATLTFEEGNRTVLKGWSQYLGITEEEAELYYSCSWSGREENENVTVFLMAE